MKEKIIPIKSLGQNFLIDKNIIKKIINEFSPKSDDIIVEIGPGKGALTSMLIDKVKKLIAIEIDKRAINYLKENFSSIDIIGKDFLKVDLRSLSNEDKKIRVIGNIPYNITSSILFKLIEERDIIKDAVLMVQYEVAKRITAPKGTKDYGILSVLLDFFADTKYCFKISPNVFYPKPKVYSSIIHILFKKKLSDFDDKLFINVVKAAFGNRRKTLKNSISNSIFRNINFQSLSHLLSKRAEDLSIEEFLQIYHLIKCQL